MEELKEIIAKVKQALTLKEQEIENANTVSTYVHDALDNRRLELALFENSAKHVTKDPTQKSTIIKNFQEGAKDLIKQINKIEV